jgi:FHS family L-fucose permease-like MFS transporter
VWGLAYGLLDVLNKHFQETLHVGKAQSAWLQIAYFGAYLSLSIPAGQLLKARGYKTGLISGLVLTAVGALLFVPAAQAESFPFFVCSMYVMAAGLCVLETAADTYVSVLGPPSHAPQRLNLAQSFNALGVVMGPFVGGLLFFNSRVTRSLGGAQTAVELTYLVIALGVLAFAYVLKRARLPEIRDSVESTADHPTQEPTKLRNQRHFVLGVLTQALYVGAQVGVGAYFINLVTETWSGLSSQQGAFLLSLAMIGYLLGRFSSTALLLYVSPRSMLAAYGLINVILCVIVSAGIEKVSPMALIAVFFFMGTMFATIFTLGIKGLGPLTKRGSALMVMAIGGGAVLPYPMGRLAELYGMPVAFLLPAACFAVVAFYGLRGAALDEAVE